MRCDIELSAQEIREAICDYISARSGVRIKPADVNVLVKSNRNYRSEWETAEFKAKFSANTVSEPSL